MKHVPDDILDQVNEGTRWVREAPENIRPEPTASDCCGVRYTQLSHAETGKIKRIQLGHDAFDSRRAPLLG